MLELQHDIDELPASDKVTSCTKCSRSQNNQNIVMNSLI
jgi:hypothetical protein